MEKNHPFLRVSKNALLWVSL